jgi:hypothetical protein
MTSIEKLEKEVEKIKDRNFRVEKDKAWETSLTRRIFIAISTYILISILLIVTHANKPLVSAIIPAAAYLISTFTLGILKTQWMKRQK